MLWETIMSGVLEIKGGSSVCSGKTSRGKKEISEEISAWKIHMQFGGTNAVIVDPIHPFLVVHYSRKSRSTCVSSQQAGKILSQQAGYTS